MNGSRTQQEFMTALASCLDCGLEDLQELPGGILQLEIPAARLARAVAGMIQTLEAQLLTLLASDQRELNGHFWLHAALHFPGRQSLIVKAAVPEDLHYPALSPLVPLADWSERELHDLFGIHPDGMALDPLVLHRDWPRAQFPLRKDFQIRNAIPSGDAAHIFAWHEPEGAHQVAVGPIHAGIIEPGHLRFSVTGEQIHHFSAQLFYTHKGLEKMAEGKTLRAGLTLAENTCAQCALSHSVAYCQALEGLAGLELPDRALALRTLGLELERLANHAADLAAITAAGGFGFASSNMAGIREQCLRLNKLFSGHRFFRGWNDLGGPRQELSPATQASLRSGLAELNQMVQAWRVLVASSSGFLDRVETTGVLSQSDAARLGLVGVAARASGLTRDVRLDRPYAAYARYQPVLALRSYGDARARMEVRLDEMQSSFNMLEALLAQLPEGPGHAEMPGSLPAGVPALGVVESARGELVHWIELASPDQIARWHVRAAAYMNWRGVVLATMGQNIVPDGPLINKSFNLCYACVDR